MPLCAWRGNETEVPSVWPLLMWTTCCIRVSGIMLEWAVDTAVWLLAHQLAALSVLIRIFIGLCPWLGHSMGAETQVKFRLDG